MADVINLIRIKKVLARDGQTKHAAEQRVRHGMTKAERSGIEQRRARAAAMLEGHRRNSDTDEPGSPGSTDQPVRD